MRRNQRFKMITVLLLALFLMTGCGGKGNTASDEATESARTDAAQETSDAESGSTEEEPEEEELTEEEIQALVDEGRTWYYGLDGKNVDDDKAMELFLKAADYDSADACYYLARIHVSREESEEAMNDYEKALETDPVHGLALLGKGLALLNGAVGEADPEQAAECFQKAVDAGCVEANVGFGQASYHGIGTDMDDAAAMEYFMKAADAPEPEWRSRANSYISDMYFYGYGTEADTEEAVAYGRKAYDANGKRDSYCAYQTGCALMRGAMDADGRVVDEARMSEGIRLLKEAADAGDIDANEELAFYYYAYESGYDPENALRYYLKAADAGDDTFAMQRAGDVYRRMYLTSETDDASLIDKMMEAYEKASDAGDETASMYLAEIYAGGGMEYTISTIADATMSEDLTGKEITRGIGDIVSITGTDYQKAAAYYRKAEEQGYVFEGFDSYQDMEGYLQYYVNNGTIDEEVLHLYRAG